MKNLLLFTLLFTSSIFYAQTTFTVNVANGGFTPSNLTITVGDTVKFVNVSGTHWVDGRQVTFASNPASFDNQSQSGAGWTYKQVFNTAGNYDYRCGIHTTTMIGALTVQIATGIEETVINKNTLFYPNPTSNQLNFSEFENIDQVAIYSLTGEEVVNTPLIKKQLDVSTLITGIYFVKVTSKNGEVITKKMVIQ